MADPNDYSARRRAQANARREAAGRMQPMRVSGSAEEARMARARDLERSSSTRRDASADFRADERTSVQRAAEADAALSFGARQGSVTTHRAQRSAMSTPVPRGQQRPAEGYELYGNEAEETEERARPQAQPYVRRERPRRTQDAIDDMEADELYDSKNFVHDSGITIGRSNPFNATGRAYRRSRGDLPQLHSGHGYGRYLEVPKGHGSLFNMEQRRRKRRSAIAVGVVLLAVALLVLVIRSFFFQG